MESVLSELNWDLLKSFRAVMQTGTLSAASQLLGQSQPTLGRHINELEAHFGVVLFSRGKKGLKPTENALLIADQVEQIATSADRVGLTLSGRTESLTGAVRISASQMVANLVLPPLIGRLLEDTPGLQVELLSSNTVENLTTRDADIAIRMVRPEQSSLIAKKINDMRLGMFATRAYLEKHGMPERPEDLAGHVVIGYDKADLIIKGMATFGLQVERDFFRFRCDDQVACWMAATKGVGIGFGPAHQASNYPDLVPVAQQYDIGSLPVWLVTHEELKTSRRIRHVFDFLAREIGALDL